MTLKFKTIELENAINILSAVHPSGCQDCEWIDLKIDELFYKGRITPNVRIRLIINFAASENSMYHYSLFVDDCWRFQQNEIVELNDLKKTFDDIIYQWGKDEDGFYEPITERKKTQLDEMEKRFYAKEIDCNNASKLKREIMHTA